MKPAIMSDAKSETTSEAPTYIVTTGATSETKPQRGNVQKKYIIIGISAVLVVGLIIAGILIGVHIFAEAQKEIVKFSFQFKGSQNNDIKQDVEADPNDNVVMYHITQSEQDAYIVNDFNKGIQTIKITAGGMTKCFVRPLNVSEAMDPSKITDAKSMTGSQSQEGSSMPFHIASDPVVDRSFLTKKAKDICSGVDLHWAYRKCKDSTFVPVNQTESGLSKRALYYMAPKYGMGGIGGCCWAYWACYVRMTEYIDGYYHRCQTYYETTWCCYANPYYNPPIAYPYCQNLYYAYWQTPGLYCPGPSYAG